MTEPKKLTTEQKALFNLITSALRKEVALEYIKNGYENGTKAYISACANLNRKPSKNPETSASEILSYPNVTDFIDSIKVVVAERVQIDAQWVLESAKKVFDRCMQYEKVVDKSGEPVIDIDGCPIYKFEPSPANKALEIIGKHVSVKAFEDHVKVDSIVSNIMPVPAASSISGWEEAAQTQQSEILGRKDEV